MNDDTPGLAKGSARLASTLLDSARTRLELLGLEVAEERERILRLLIVGGVGLVVLLLGLVTMLLALVFAFWEQRFVIALFMAVLFLGSGAGALLWARRAAALPRNPLSTSVDELAEDVRRLKALAHDEPA